MPPLRLALGFVRQSTLCFCPDSGPSEIPLPSAAVTLEVRLWPRGGCLHPTLHAPDRSSHASAWIPRRRREVFGPLVTKGPSRRWARQQKTWLRSRFAFSSSFPVCRCGCAMSGRHSRPGRALRQRLMSSSLRGKPLDKTKQPLTSQQAGDAGK